MPRVVLPDSLVRLFPGAERRLQLEADTVAATLDRLNDRWPGMRDRLVDGRPAIRRHIVIFVNGERAELVTPVTETDEVYVMPAMSGG
ncbi:MAG: MoaD/ThiS family protein [Dehalococcoidia bacterium]|jgi:molybdopterin converting factor small subunit